MKKKVFAISSVLVILLIFISGRLSLFDNEPVWEKLILSYQVDLEHQNLQFFSIDGLGQNFSNHGNLKDWLESKDQELVFAMNGGMFLKDLSPQGLYIEDHKVIKIVDTTQTAYGNFYMQPNGVFYITDENKAEVCQTNEFHENDKIIFATQSGPMLIINGKIHPKFTEGSQNLFIRNGVGMLPNGNLLFAMSKDKINFFDFASYFISQGCENALYLDGFVSRTYLPSKNWEQMDGNFGIIIAEVK